MNDSNRIVIHTDGACSGNPGPGGWGAILQWNGQTKEICGGEAMTTNNRMELQAVIEALQSVKRALPIDIYTDSQYVKNGITEWVEGWEKKGWKTAANKPVKNIELWQALSAAAAPHHIQWHWVKGHSGHELNERVDALAREGMRPFKRSAD